MHYPLLTATGIVFWPDIDPVPDDEPTPLELQRWEDDGGAVPPPMRYRHRLSDRECDERLFDTALAELISAG